jgi:hypothetical protein
MSFQDLFEFKKMEDYFIDVDDWKKCLLPPRTTGPYTHFRNPACRSIIVEWLGAEHESVTTKDGRTLDALWLEAPPVAENCGTCFRLASAKRPSVAPE